MIIKLLHISSRACKGWPISSDSICIINIYIVKHTRGYYLLTSLLHVVKTVSRALPLSDSSGEGLIGKI
jgi:hypothetical protein